MGVDADEVAPVTGRPHRHAGAATGRAVRRSAYRSGRSRCRRRGRSRPAPRALRPAGTRGGNLDVNLLTEGSTLYLPVQTDGALAYVGDPHFTQGDGEVSLTALEASLRATIRLDVIAREDAITRFGELTGPVAETADYLIPTGLHEDLDIAMQNAVRAAVALLQARFGMDPRLAYAYLSAASDFRISQVVDLVKGVHATIRKADFG